MDLEFSDFEEALEALRDFEIESHSQFVTYRKTKHFNTSHFPDDLRRSRIWFSGNSNVTGPLAANTPFIVIGSWDLACIHGDKRKGRQQTNTLTDHNYKNRRKKRQETKKQGCPCKVIMQEVLAFEVQQEPTSRKRRQNLSKAIKAGKHEESKRRLFILRQRNQHSNHISGEISGVTRNISKDVSKKIHELASSGVTQVPCVQRELRIHVKRLPLKKRPSTFNQQYFPSNKTVYNHIQLAIAKNRYSTEEQENVSKHLAYLCKNEKPPGTFQYHFQAHSQEEEKKFLIVLQTTWQQELLAQFGNCLVIDSTFNTTKFNIPLYELVVHTNTGYTPIGIIITEDETEEQIAEGLSILKSWNAGWSPSVSVTDCDIAQSNALSKVFPDCSQFLCKFHIIQAWKRWLSRGENKLTGEKDAVLEHLKSIADSATKDDYHNNVQNLMDTNMWNENEHFQNYINNSWLSIAKKWVRAFRPLDEDIVVSTTNGVEVHHRILKAILNTNGCRTVQSLVDVLIKNYFEEMLKRYVTKNVQPLKTSKVYNDSVPRFLIEKTPPFMEHCLSRLADATLIDPSMVRRISESLFNVTSSSDPSKTYAVDLTAPHCECFDFQKHFMPCKHVLAVFTMYKSSSDVCNHYMNSKYFNINQRFLDWINNKDVEALASASYVKQKKARDEDDNNCSDVFIATEEIPSLALRKTNASLNKLKNFINNTNSEEAIKECNVRVTEIYSTLERKYGFPSSFSKMKSRSGNNGKLQVPSSFLKTKVKNRRRLQNRRKVHSISKRNLRRESKREGIVESHFTGEEDKAFKEVQMTFCEEDEEILIEECVQAAETICKDKEKIAPMEGLQESETICKDKEELASKKGLQEAETFCMDKERIALKESLQKAETVCMDKEEITPKEGLQEAETVCMDKEKITPKEGLQEAETVCMDEEEITPKEGLQEAEQTVCMDKEEITPKEGLQEAETVCMDVEEITPKEGLQEAETVCMDEEEITLKEGLQEAERFCKDKEEITPKEGLQKTDNPFDTYELTMQFDEAMESDIESYSPITERELNTFFEKVPFNPSFQIPLPDYVEINPYNPHLLRMKVRENKLSEDEIPDSVKNYKPKRKIKLSSYKETETVCKDKEEIVPEEVLQEVEDPIIPDIEEIWKNHRGSPSLMAIVGPYKLYGTSFDSLRSGMEVTDEIIDAYLQSLIDAGNHNVSYISCVVAGKLLLQPSVCALMTSLSLDAYEQIFCPYNNNGHWEMFVVMPKEKTIKYIDPLGELTKKGCNILRSWKTFINRRFSAGLESTGPSKWKLETIQHSKQMDSVSCGVFIMKFAELLIQGKPLFFNSRHVDTIRKDIAAILLGSCGNVTNNCRSCGQNYRLQHKWIQCNSCQWWHHFQCADVSRSYDEASDDSFYFICKTCRGLDTQPCTSQAREPPMKKKKTNQDDSHGRKDNLLQHEQKVSTELTREPFVVCKLSNLVKLCAGCRERFEKPLRCPKDIGIRHREMDSFFDRKEGRMREVFNNKYYHVSANCIQARNPLFTKSSICVPPDLKLTQEHLAHFKCHGVDLTSLLHRKI
ncbi:uncharacterized protein LOC134283018 [Saccostrea cucullata]|uniref:uncharacterized protein LOC134283018 n=1 Tax=Saccostrea cuccullata TaxID=36930 RepID=UPI002ED67B19